MSIYYLTVDQISQMNAFQILNYSPNEKMGIKDLSALEMAVNQPSQIVFGQELYPSIEEKVAILMINLVKKYPFFNGNERTAVMAADVFLQFNGYDISFELEEGIELVVDIATYEAEEFNHLKNIVTRIFKSKMDQQL